MPVSYLPVIIPFLLIIIPFLLCVSRGIRAAGIAACISVLLVAIFFLSVYVPGWLLMSKAGGGDPKALYRLAKWHENHSEEIQAFFLCPWCEPDVLSGYACLEKAAEQDYPPALYAVGVRLKYGEFVPRPKLWDGPEGNCFPQPSRGQTYIDRAIELGYKPVVEEKYFYYHVYRGMYVKDPYG